MSKDESLKSVLSYQNSVVVLVFLYRSGGKSKAVFISDVVGNYNSVKSAGSRLKDAGLITITEHAGQSGYFLYELTDLGRDVAQHLDAAERAISGEPAAASMPSDHGALTAKRDKVS